MILHTVNKEAGLTRCLALLSADSAVLLLEDGVYTAFDSAGNRALWQQAPEDSRLFALADDLAARGISDKMLPRFEIVSWERIVALSLEYDKVVSWG